MLRSAESGVPAQRSETVRPATRRRSRSTKPRDGLQRERQLLAGARLLDVERGQGDAEQAHAQPHRQQRREQVERDAARAWRGRC